MKKEISQPAVRLALGIFIGGFECYRFAVTLCPYRFSLSHEKFALVEEKYAVGTKIKTVENLTNRMKNVDILSLDTLALVNTEAVHWIWEATTFDDAIAAFVSVAVLVVVVVVSMEAVAATPNSTIPSSSCVSAPSSSDAIVLEDGLCLP